MDKKTSHEFRRRKIKPVIHKNKNVLAENAKTTSVPKPCSVSKPSKVDGTKVYILSPDMLKKFGICMTSLQGSPAAKQTHSDSKSQKEISSSENSKSSTSKSRSDILTNDNSNSSVNLSSNILISEELSNSNIEDSSNFSTDSNILNLFSTPEKIKSPLITSLSPIVRELITSPDKENLNENIKLLPGNLTENGIVECTKNIVEELNCTNDSLIDIEPPLSTIVSTIQAISENNTPSVPSETNINDQIVNSITKFVDSACHNSASAELADLKLYRSCSESSDKIETSDITALICDTMENNTEIYATQIRSDEVISESTFVSSENNLPDVQDQVVIDTVYNTREPIINSLSNVVSNDVNFESISELNNNSFVEENIQDFNINKIMDISPSDIEIINNVPDKFVPNVNDVECAHESIVFKDNDPPFDCSNQKNASEIETSDLLKDDHLALNGSVKNNNDVNNLCNIEPLSSEIDINLGIGLDSTPKIGSTQKVFENNSVINNLCNIEPLSSEIDINLGIGLDSTPKIGSTQKVYENNSVINNICSSEHLAPVIEVNQGIHLDLSPKIGLTQNVYENNPVINNICNSKHLSLATEASQGIGLDSSSKIGLTRNIVKNNFVINNTSNSEHLSLVIGVNQEIGSDLPKIRSTQNIVENNSLTNNISISEHLSSAVKVNQDNGLDSSSKIRLIQKTDKNNSVINNIRNTERLSPAIEVSQRIGLDSSRKIGLTQKIDKNKSVEDSLIQQKNEMYVENQKRTSINKTKGCSTIVPLNNVSSKSGTSDNNDSHVSEIVAYLQEFFKKKSCNNQENDLGETKSEKLNNNIVTKLNQDGIEKPGGITNNDKNDSLQNVNVEKTLNIKHIYENQSTNVIHISTQDEVSVDVPSASLFDDEIDYQRYENKYENIDEIVLNNRNENNFINDNFEQLNVQKQKLKVYSRSSPKNRRSSKILDSNIINAKTYAVENLQVENITKINKPSENCAVTNMTENNNLIINSCDNLNNENNTCAPNTAMLQSNPSCLILKEIEISIVEVEEVNKSDDSVTSNIMDVTNISSNNSRDNLLSQSALILSPIQKPQDKTENENTSNIVTKSECTDVDCGNSVSTKIARPLRGRPRKVKGEFGESTLPANENVPPRRSGRSKKSIEHVIIDNCKPTRETNENVQPRRKRKSRKENNDESHQDNIVNIPDETGSNSELKDLHLHQIENPEKDAEDEDLSSRSLSYLSVFNISLETRTTKGRPKKSECVKKRNRNRQKKVEILEYSAENFPTCKCAICSKEMLLRDFPNHSLNVHNLLAWIEGDPPLDLTNEKLVHKLLDAKVKIGKKLICEKCNLVRLTAYGFTSHLITCQKSEEEISAAKVQCEVCNKSVLPVSMKSHMKIHEREAQLPVIVEEKPVEVTDVSRKRKAATAALESFKKLKTSNETVDNEVVVEKINIKNFYIKPISKAINPWHRRAWNRQKAAGGPIHCGRRNCNYADMTEEGIIDHYVNKCPILTTIKDYTCITCKKVFTQECDVVAHITKSHQHLLTRKPGSYKIHRRNDDDYDDVASMDDDDDDIDDEDNSDNRQNKKGRSAHRDRSSIDGALAIPSSFSREVNDWTNQSFYKKYADILVSNNFSEQTLFNELFCDSYVSLTDEEAMKYLPNNKQSCHIAHVLYDSKVGKYENLDWKQYALHSSDLFNDALTMWCGGSVWSVSWVPGERQNSYLAVAADNEIDPTYYAHNIYSVCNVIQFWDVGQLTNQNGKCLTPAHMVFGIAHDYGVVWDMDWCPSGCNNDCFDNSIDMELNSRMGLLGIACSNGNAYIYAVPHPRFLNRSESKLYSSSPSVVLHLDAKYSDDLCKTVSQASKISWSPFNKHKVVAVGYTNGFVALFDLSTESQLLKWKDSKTIHILPYFKLQPYTEPINGLTFIPRFSENMDDSNLVIGISSSQGYSVWVNSTRISKRRGRFTNITSSNPWPMIIAIPEEISRIVLVRPPSYIVSSSPASGVENSVANATYFPGGGLLDSNMWSNKIVVAGKIGNIMTFPVKTPFLKCHLTQRKALAESLLTFSKEVNLSINSNDIECDTSNTLSDNSQNPNDDIGYTSSYEYMKTHFGLVFVDVPRNVKLDKVPQNIYEKADVVKNWPLRNTLSMKINPSPTSNGFVAYGGQAGQVRIIYTGAAFNIKNK